MVEVVVYLGRLVTKDNDVMKEIERRMAMSWCVFNRHRQIFRSLIEIGEKQAMKNRKIAGFNIQL